MAAIWFVEIFDHPIEKKFLISEGIRPKQVNTWKHSQSTENGFQNLIERAGLLSDSKNHTTTLIQIPVAITEEVKYLEDYFALYVTRIIEKMGFGGYHVSQSNIPDIIIFNFLPFFIRATGATRIARGISMIMATLKELNKTSLVLLTRSHSLFSDSGDLIELCEIDQGPNTISVIDFDGNYSIYRRLNNKVDKDSGKLNAIDARDKILVHSEDSLRLALIYDTNINIGHFDLGSCHVRTHYDLYDFVRYDNVFASVLKKFLTTINFTSDIHLIATGLEDEALRVVGNRLKYNLENNLRMEFGEKFDSYKIIWHNHYSYHQFIQDNDLLKNICPTDRVVILTDVVNTGNTAFNLKKFIDSQLEEHSDLKSIKSTIFSIVKMANSPDDLTACVKINRPYFLGEEDKCPLCVLQQPITNVDPDNWKSDFRKVEPQQLTPLDFWEIVEDCQAFNAKSDEILRVSTLRMMRRYKKWLCNVMHSKFQTTWPKQTPNLIITVDENSGRTFASLLIEILNLPENILVIIHKDFITSKRTPPDSLIKKLQSINQRDLKAFLVDDGINTGRTMFLLKKFITQFSVEPFGALVLDNRLSYKKLIEIFGLNFAQNIKALYTWPFPPITNRT